MSLPDAPKVYRRGSEGSREPAIMISLTPPPVISSSNTSLLDFRSTFAFKLIIAALVLLLLPAGQAFAATINVDSGCTLTNAINEANGETTGVGSCEAGTDGNGATGADTIELSGNITLSGFLPQIKSHITINGNNNFISGNDQWQVFYGRQTSAISISLTINDLTIRNSIVRHNVSTNTTHRGGAIGIFSGSGLATLTINNSTFHGNSAINPASNPAPINQNGGAIECNYVNLTITNSVFYDNEAINGGAVSCNGNVTIKRSSFYNNTANTNGVALDIASMGFGFATTVLIENSSFYGNTTTVTASNVDGGAIVLNLKDASSPGSATLRHVTVTRNSSARGHHGLFSDSLASSPLHIQNSILYGNGDNDCQIKAGAGAPATNSGNIIGSGNCGAAFSSANPLLASSATGRPPYFTFREDSPAKDAATCISGVTTDQRGAPRPQGSLCDIGAYEGPGHPSPVNNAPSSGSGGDDEESDADDDSYKAPPPSTCLTLDGIAAYNLSESTQCQRVNAMQIANPAIKDGDFVEAVDVWGWVTPNSEICFEAAGSAIKFIDTAAMPRTVSDLSAFSRQDTVCATIDGPGILVLLPGDAPAAGSGQTASSASRGLSGCMVRLTEKLNFRETPGGEIMEVLSKDFKLTAEERTDAWFKVDFWGKKGWISADYVVTEGACG